LHCRIYCLLIFFKSQIRSDAQMAKNGEQGLEIKRMLVPIDGSVDSKKAIVLAIKLAKLLGASLTFLHCVPVPYYTSQMAGGLLLRQKYLEESTKFAEDIISNAKQSAKKEGLPDSAVGSMVLYDVVSIADSIVNVAARSDIDMIIIGSKGLTGIKKFLLGSVTSGVVSHASCPVLVAK